METLPDLSPGKFLLLAASGAKEKELTQEIVVRLTAFESFRALIGNNRFDAYQIARELRRHTREAADYMERIHLARAFTCYQMLTLLRKTTSAPTPTFVIGLLTTFYDENIPAYESLRVLQNCIWELKRLSRSAPLIVSVNPKEEREELYSTIQNAADVTLIPNQKSGGATTQLTLWDEH